MSTLHSATGASAPPKVSRPTAAMRSVASPLQAATNTLGTRKRTKDVAAVFDKRPTPSNRESVRALQPPITAAQMARGQQRSPEVRAAPPISAARPQPAEASRPPTRLEREKKRHYNDPPNVGPWKLGKLIGQGASGRVRVAIHSRTQQKAAVKIIPKQMLINSRMSLRDLSAKQDKLTLGIEREIVIMKLIEHPNLLGLWDVYETSKELFLVMEYVAGGELFDYLVARGRLQPDEARMYFRQVIFGVDYCHTFSICHRDLKPENLLLDGSRSVVKIADFGMAALQPTEKMLETSCGSPHYASPEIVSGKTYDGTASDIWSCGIILFALLCGRLPFDDPNIQMLLSKVRSGKFAMPSHLDPEVKDLISRMLQTDPKKRATMHEICNHPWFTDHGRLSSHNPVSTEISTLANEPVQLADIDPDILGNLSTLWPELSHERIIRCLLEPGPNWQKTFYSLLVIHRDRHGSDDEEDEDDEDLDEDDQLELQRNRTEPPQAPPIMPAVMGKAAQAPVNNSLGLVIGHEEKERLEEQPPAPVAMSNQPPAAAHVTSTPPRAAATLPAGTKTPEMVPPTPLKDEVTERLREQARAEQARADKIRADVAKAEQSLAADMAAQKAREEAEAAALRAELQRAEDERKEQLRLEQEKAQQLLALKAAEEQARKAAEEQARKAAEEQARKAAEEQARKAKEEQARKAAEATRLAVEAEARKAVEARMARDAAARQAAMQKVLDDAARQAAEERAALEKEAQVKAAASTPEPSAPSTSAHKGPGRRISALFSSMPFPGRKTSLASLRTSSASHSRSTSPIPPDAPTMGSPAAAPVSRPMSPSIKASSLAFPTNASPRMSSPVLPETKTTMPATKPVAPTTAAPVSKPVTPTTTAPVAKPGASSVPTPTSLPLPVVIEVPSPASVRTSSTTETKPVAAKAIKTNPLMLSPAKQAETKAEKPVETEIEKPVPVKALETEKPAQVRAVETKTEKPVEAHAVKVDMPTLSKTTKPEEAQVDTKTAEPIGIRPVTKPAIDSQAVTKSTRPVPAPPTVAAWKQRLPSVQAAPNNKRIVSNGSSQGNDDSLMRTFMQEIADELDSLDSIHPTLNFEYPSPRKTDTDMGTSSILPASIRPTRPAPAAPTQPADLTLSSVSSTSDRFDDATEDSLFVTPIKAQDTLHRTHTPVYAAFAKYTSQVPQATDSPRVVSAPTHTASMSSPSPKPRASDLGLRPRYRESRAQVPGMPQVRQPVGAREMPPAPATAPAPAAPAASTAVPASPESPRIGHTTKLMPRAKPQQQAQALGVGLGRPTSTPKAETPRPQSVQETPIRTRPLSADQTPRPQSAMNASPRVQSVSLGSAERKKEVSLSPKPLKTMTTLPEVKPVATSPVPLPTSSVPTPSIRLTSVSSTATGSGRTVSGASTASTAPTSVASPVSVASPTFEGARFKSIQPTSPPTVPTSTDGARTVSGASTTSQSKAHVRQRRSFLQVLRRDDEPAGLGVDIIGLDKDNMHLQRPMSPIGSEPVTTTAGTSSTIGARHSWFYGLLPKRQMHVLMSVENLTLTAETCQQMLQRLGAVPTPYSRAQMGLPLTQQGPLVYLLERLQDPKTQQVISCKPMRFRVEYTILPIRSQARSVSESGTKASSNASTTPKSPGMPGWDPRTHRRTDDEPLSFATSVTCTHEKGSLSTFRQFMDTLRREWTLDSAAE
ncbi:serine/threonine-protein kinase Gin4 [Malassezia pachydermatis]|uniref:non-specific serine/threonine protein kinase n=1 Tax=Malassezia pachydermatis TaxID=77020 RepID=A0A0M9VPP9_9BASI|nr:serine threonine-protein kinase [Malassezia pachydermatis]KOS14693.1 serine threonine-protein kinase [Malassezia pachydermatis]